MKLIHCADLHLGSSMRSHLPPEKAKIRKAEILDTFRRLTESAEEAGVSAILIAGDLFDAVSVSQKNLAYVSDLIGKHPTISFFYLSGNHDLGAGLKDTDNLPKNLFFFGEEWTTYDIAPNITVTGSEHPIPETLSPLPEGKINLLLLHGQIAKGAGRTSSDCIYPSKYKGKNIDYLALGHLHSYRTEPLDRRGILCYPGCLEGRGFDEVGEKGYVLLSTDEQKITAGFIPFAKRRVSVVECDITGFSSVLDLEERAKSALSEVPAENLVRLVLTGSFPPRTHIDISGLQNRIGESFFYLEVRSECHPEIKASDYEKEVSLKGEFVRSVLKNEKLTDDEKDQIIVCGLRALAGEEEFF